MNKKRMIIVTSTILSIIVISLSILKIYDTYALGNYVDGVNDSTYNIYVTEDNSIEVPKNSYKNVFYMVLNTNSGTVNYNVAYTKDDNIIVRYYEDIGDSASGTIDENERKYIKLRITNTSNTSKTVTLSTILGYVNGGDLIYDTSNLTLVSESVIGNFANHITNLYTNAEKTIVTNNSIEYNYATSVSLMNDRLGGTTTDYDDGNIRYYGASPNNYVYFNCSDYSNQSSSTCEIWRIIGVFNGKVKISFAGSISTYSYDNKLSGVGSSTSANGSNDWSDSRLMIMLNPTDYSSTFSTNIYAYDRGSYWYGLNSTCYAGIHSDTSGTITCNFASTGSNSGLRNDDTRNMIAEETYYLGGPSGSNSAYYSDEIYSIERTAGNVYSGHSSSWTGKVAIPYASDIGYAADFNSCKTTLGYYSNEECYDNWLRYYVTWNRNSIGYVLDTNPATSHFGWTIMPEGNLYYTYYVYWARSITPVLYLNSDVVIRSGTGSSTNPYKLS